MKSFDPRVFFVDAKSSDNAHIIGSKCDACGAVFFPQQPLCTECFRDGTMKYHALSKEGKVYSYTIVERETLAPKGFKVPYSYGYVELPEGVRVISKIVDWSPETLKLEAPVELVLETLREDPSGEKVMGFRFRISQTTSR